MAKAERELYGHAGSAIPATRVLVKDIDHDFNGKKGQTLIVINDATGKFMSFNITTARPAGTSIRRP